MSKSDDHRSSRTETWQTTLLINACLDGHLKAVSDAIKHGFDLNAKDHIGRTPLFCAAFKGCIDVVRELIAADVDVDCATEYGITALTCASHFGYLDVVMELLNAGADLSIASCGGTPLVIAARSGQPSVLRELVKRSNVLRDYEPLSREERHDITQDKACRKLLRRAYDPSRYCTSCSKFIDTQKLRCSVCKQVTYCSAACQKDHWILHQSCCAR